jgi:hypothetical protein
VKEEVKTRVSKNSQGYGYKYTDLAQIHEYLEENGMSYYQYVETDSKGDDYIITVPIINGEEQKPRRGVKIVDAVLQGIKNPAQEQGSATTYARRYSLLMAFGLATEDDDAQCLTKTNEEEQPKKETHKKVSKATEKQIELIKELYSEEEIEKALDIVKKENIEDLTVVEASSLISKRKELANNGTSKSRKWSK